MRLTAFTDYGLGALMRLAGEPTRVFTTEQISIGEVVRRLEARHAIVECFRVDADNCVLTPRCRLKLHLRRAAE